jgi:hypothetical protein
LIINYWLLIINFSHKHDYNLSNAISESSDISMADSDNDDLDIYIRD